MVDATSATSHGPPAKPVPARPSMADCYRFGWSRVGSSSFTVAGGIMLYGGLQSMRWTRLAWIEIASGVLMLTLGLLSFRGSAILIDSSSVKLKNMYQKVMRRHPIDGWNDLFFMANKLYRRSDSKMLANLSKWYVNGAQVQRFRADLAAYQARSAT